ncbi:MAG: hypothetical protein GX141_08820 [Armatimonadetes bacterium]|nr:hypothetical protein [Armatimonadota bacterium]
MSFRIEPSIYLPAAPPFLGDDIRNYAKPPPGTRRGDHKAKAPTFGKQAWVKTLKRTHSDRRRPGHNTVILPG